MKSPHVAALLTLLFPAWSAITPTSAPAVAASAVDEYEVDVRDLAAVAKLSMRDAIARALAAEPGRAVEVELEGVSRDGQLHAFFEVEILTAALALVDVRVDAASGEVVEREAEEFDTAEFAAMSAALRHSEFDLAALVEKAASYVKGMPVEAELEYEDGTPLCEVAFVNSRFVIEVEVEGRAGHLVELELRPEEGLEDGEHGDEEAGEEEEAVEAEHESAEEEGEEHARGAEHGAHGHHHGGR